MSAQRHMEPSLYTPKDIAARWQVSVRLIHNMIERGELPAVRLGPKLLRIRPTDIDALEASLCPITGLSDLRSTDESPPSGTSPGQRTDGRIAFLRARQT